MGKLLQKKKTLFVAAMAALALHTSCSDSSNSSEIEEVDRITEDFHIAFANGSESNSATLVQGVNDLSTGAVSSKKGYELESSRTARVFSSEDGGTIYSLNYTVGTIEKLSYLGGDKYTRIARIDASVPLGHKAVRFTKLNEELGSVHYIKATAQYENPEDDKSKYLGHSMTASIGILDLITMKFKEGYNNNIEVKIDEELTAQGYYISRIDAPVLSGNKLYYGAAVSKFDANTAKRLPTDKTFTLVIDMSDLSKTSTVITTHVQGSTNGYRTPTQHVNESNEILQLVSGMNSTSNKHEVHIVKLKDGKYTDYDLNLTELLGKETKSNGYFYAGNDIAYIPYEDFSKEKIQIGVNPEGEPTYSAMWKLARVDLKNKTAIDLNVPDDLWLTQYQSGVVRNGVFYIALSPIGKDGNIYMFDVASENKDGKLGASLSGTGADQYYIGIY